jgi:molybdate transport system substrate-binding protein
MAVPARRDLFARGHVEVNMAAAEYAAAMPHILMLQFLFMRKTLLWLIPILLLAAAGALAYRLVPGLGRPAGGNELVLYCAAGMRPGCDALIKAFQAKHNARIAVTYEGSGQSLGKIAAGAPGDLFMPGAAFYVDQASQRGLLVEGSRRTVAWWVPVLLVRKAQPPLNVKTVADLAGPGLRVGLGDERSAAVGQVSLEILKKNGVAYERLNVVTKPPTVEELGVAVQVGAVDAAIVWDITARRFLASADMVAIPPESNVVSEVPIAVLKSSRRPELAQAFVDFAASAEAKRLLVEQGFTVEPPK